MSARRGYRTGSFPLLVRPGHAACVTALSLWECPSFAESQVACAGAPTIFQMCPEFGDLRCVVYRIGRFILRREECVD